MKTTAEEKDLAYNERRYYSTTDMTRMLGVTPSTMIRWAKRGDWEFIKVGRDYKFPVSKTNPRLWRLGIYPLIKHEILDAPEPEEDETEVVDAIDNV